MPLPDAEAAEVTRLYRASTVSLAAAGGDAVAEAWDDLGSYNEADVRRLVQAAGPAVEVISREAAATTAAYLALLLDESPMAATGLVTPDWRGPFTWFWRSLGQDQPLDMALQSGRSRAVASGHKAVISTARRTGSLVDDRVAGWRRTLSGDPCQWCINVAGQRYHSAASADFGHDHCSCGVTPILA